MNITELALDMAKAVEIFMQKARKFFYSIMLLSYRCPACDGQLTMVAESRCKCALCGKEFDPTVEFQRCSTCGGAAVLWVRRYRCESCRGDIKSKFLFDGLVFDAKYFRGKMAESRQLKKEERERVTQMLADIVTFYFAPPTIHCQKRQVNYV